MLTARPGAPGVPTSRPAAGRATAPPRAWWRRLAGWAQGAGGHPRSVTAVMLGERCTLVRVEAPSATGKPLLRTAAEGPPALLRRWREDGWFKHSLPLLVLPTEQRHLLTMDRPEVPEAELRLALRWPLAEAMEAEPEALLATGQTLPAINDNQRPQVLAVGARLPLVQQQLATLQAAGIAVRHIDVVDSALRGMALLQAHANPAPSEALAAEDSQVVLAFLGHTLGIGLVWRGAFCALRTLALPRRAPRDEADFEDHLALHIQRTTDQFERQATRLAVRQVLAAMPALPPAARQSVRQALPLEARLFALPEVFELGTSTLDRCESDNTLTALAAVAAARLFDLGHLSSPHAATTPEGDHRQGPHSTAPAVPEHDRQPDLPALEMAVDRSTARTRAPGPAAAQEAPR